MQLRCFLDMDGVIADFMGSLLKAHGRPDPYAIPENLGKFDTEKLWGISDKEFWAPVAENSLEFWQTIPKTKEADEIVRVVTEEFGEENIAILTAPSKDHGSVPGKRAWIKKRYPQFYKRMIFATAGTKQFLAGPGKFLVDDKDSNFLEFNRAGGNGVLVPRPWNCQHMYQGIILELVSMEIIKGKQHGR